ncbi:MAG TPA: T9SS type A sorting domain-containing protein [Ignavibacteriaceae bacterium]|nr:T9SS type A sorting domain-containing protein [Ignavibacteriaceae bacterium]
MKRWKLFVICFLLSLSIQSFAQVEYTDRLLENSIFTSAPEEVKSKKPFAREWWFLEQRAYPNDFIPENAYLNAIRERDAQRVTNGIAENITWVSLGPTPGAYFSYGNISSRIVTGAYNPSNPNIIYVGPANGGVWKSVDAGVNWQPLTDNQPSLAMGAIVIDPANPNIVYAGTGEATYSGASYYGRGLLKSTDAGNNWVHITSGIPSSSYFSRLIIRPNHSNELLAALGSSGLYKSTNGGVNWSQLIAGRCDDVLFSQTGDTAFAVGSGVGGLRRSIDGGATFSAFGTGLGSGSRTHFDYCKTSPSVMYAAVYSGSTVSAYTSTNYGANWSFLTSALDGGQAWYDLHCKVSPWNPNHVFIGTIDVFRSTNGGANFANITLGYQGGNVHVDQHNLFFHPTDQNTFIVTNDGGIWRTTNNGNSFVNLNQNLTLTQFYRIAASPFDPGRILGGTQDNGTQQTFSKLNWAGAFGGDGGEVCFNHMVANDQNIIGETQNGGLVRTTNGGTSWNNATTGINMGENVTWVAPIIKHPNISSNFYVARQRIYLSSDYGASWNAISNNVNGSNAVRELNQSKSNPDIMFATSGSQVFKSTNGGVSWLNITSGLPARTITSVYIHPTNSDLVVLTFSGFGTNKVYKTTNGGTNWFSIHGNLPDSPVNDIFIYTYDAQNPNTYFVATDVGVFLTKDDGLTWKELADGLPNTVIMHLDYSPSNQMLRAGTHGRGVYEAFIDFTVPVELSSFNASVIDKEILLSWITATETNNKGFEIERKFKNNEWEKIGFIEGKGTTTETQSYRFNDDYNNVSYSGRVLYRLKQIDFDGSFEHSKIIYTDIDFTPQTFNLSQNYPNPFNPVTNINYSVPLESEVKIFILNSLGQQVAELVNKIHSEGFYEVSWNANELASGVYFYTMEAVSTNKQLSFQDTKKLLLIK